MGEERILMIPKTDIQRYSELSCEKVAERLEIDVSRHKAICFMHDDHNPSLTFFGPNRSRWKCFACDKGGNAINLVQEYYGFSFVEACEWLEQHFGSGVVDHAYMPKKASVRKQNETKETEPAFSSDIAQAIIEESQLTQAGKQFLFDERKYDKKVIHALHIVSIEKAEVLINKLQKRFRQDELVKSGFFTLSNAKIYLRFFTPCLMLPYYDENRSIIGVQSRYLGKESNAPRFQFVSGQKTRLFNLPILATMQYGEDLYISEGVTDCMALLSSGKKAVAIPSATILPEDDLYKLRYYRLHMYPDQDNAGDSAFAKLKEFYINHYATLLREKLPDGVKDYSDYYRMQKQ